MYQAFGQGDVAAILDAVAEGALYLVMRLGCTAAREAAYTAAAARLVRIMRHVAAGRGRPVATLAEAFGSAEHGGRGGHAGPSTGISGPLANDTDVHTVVRFRARSRATGKSDQRRR